MFTGYAFASFHRTALNSRPTRTPMRANDPREEGGSDGLAQWVCEATGKAQKAIKGLGMLLLQATIAPPILDQNGPR